VAERTKATFMKSVSRCAVAPIAPPKSRAHAWRRFGAYNATPQLTNWVVFEATWMTTAEPQGQADVGCI
jgi:hypothetical protein